MNKPPKPPRAPEVAARRPSPVDYEPCEPTDEKPVGASSTNPFAAENSNNVVAERPSKSPEMHAAKHLPPALPPKPSKSTGKTSTTQSVTSVEPTPAEKQLKQEKQKKIQDQVALDVYPLRTNRRNKEENANLSLFHKNSLSEVWLSIVIAIHCVQWGLLLAVGHVSLPLAAFAMLVIAMVTVTALLFYARWRVRKKRSAQRVRLRVEFTPEDESDAVPDAAVNCLIAATILEGCMFAAYTALVAGVGEQLYNSVGLFTRATMLQTLRFTSITFLAFHRVIRPANRVDPMRTIMELEVTSVCWDALDGSTLYELLDNSSVLNLSVPVNNAIRVLMAFWYLSIGFRIAFIFATHLEPSNPLYRRLFPQPLDLAPQPTVDRTLAAMRVRSLIILIMTAAELYAAAIRIYLWAHGKLDPLQQDMTIKNVLFIISVYGAYNLWMNATERFWNSRELGLGFQIPSREFQLEVFRWMFVLSYLLTGALLSVILLEVTTTSDKWIANIGFDIILVVLFLWYCRNVHIQSGTAIPRFFLLPQESFVLFPGYLGSTISALMAINLFAARLPAIYYAYSRMAPQSADVLWTYDNAMLIVILSVVPIGCAGMFWSIAFLIFRKEFTACPGNYNAIHDPTIGMVATATMVEGAIDVLSAATLMQLAANNLPGQVNGAIVMVCLLECANGCQCFALQALLSGGHNDTPMDLVRWNAYLRGFRAIIDFIAFVLRVVLWVQYGAVSSVFLVKNLYNLLHTMTHVERYFGVQHYPKATLFTTDVTPADWYGLTTEQWRKATSETLVAQARAGRKV